MYTLPNLHYDYGALQRSISGDIMRLHHQKHHQGYVDKLNKALEDDPDDNKGLVALLSSPQTPQSIINSGGGHYNHSRFWEWMSPDGGGQPSGTLAEVINRTFGSYQQFVDDFSSSARGIFGSGWVWLLPSMEIVTTSNQDTPMLSGKAEPILGLDVWEHAYYLDYKNARSEYIKSWWDVVNWQYIEDLYHEQG